MWNLTNGTLLRTIETGHMVMCCAVLSYALSSFAVYMSADDVAAGGGAIAYATAHQAHPLPTLPALPSPTSGNGPSLRCYPFQSRHRSRAFHA